jgi:hypothetical protein
MALLRAGVPVTLLCDLASTADPDSAAINVAERPPKDELLLEAAEPSTARRATG